MNKTFDYDQIYYECLNRIEDILQFFDISYTETNTSFTMRCPIHLGDKPTSCCIYKNTGIFHCYSKKCHEEFGKDLIGFIRGIKKCGRGEAIKLFVNSIAGSLKQVDPKLAEKRKFVSLSNAYADITPAGKKEGFPLSVVDNQTCPPTYLIERGFCPKTLADYKVFTATKGSFEKRVVIPIRHPYIDDRYIGFTARYPGDDYKPLPKWQHSDGFKTQNNLFNFWEAKKELKDSGTVLVCEGPLDVLNLVSKGVMCAVAVFGSHMSDNQQYIIEGISPRTIILGTDNDEAGVKVRDKIRERFERQCKVVDLKFDKKDVGELTQDEVDELVKPIVEKFRKKI
jgi:DNA primase